MNLNHFNSQYIIYIICTFRLTCYRSLIDAHIKMILITSSINASRQETVYISNKTFNNAKHCLFIFLLHFKRLKSPESKGNLLCVCVCLLFLLSAITILLIRNVIQTSCKDTYKWVNNLFTWPCLPIKNVNIFLGNTLSSF